jgi:hypothetical protein
MCVFWDVGQLRGLDQPASWRTLDPPCFFNSWDGFQIIPVALRRDRVSRGRDAGGDKGFEKTIPAGVLDP